MKPNEPLYITFETAPRRFEMAVVVPELPNAGETFHRGHIHAARVIALEPFPYPCPQIRPEVYAYSVWRVLYRPMNLRVEARAFLAVHEREAESL